jgi:hypothetical protein
LSTSDRDRIEDVELQAVRANGGALLDSEAVDEGGEAAERRLLARGQQVVAPGDGAAEAALRLG